jgi:hypothetical protein
MDQWWLLGRDRKPVGPVSKALVLEGIQAGKVPSDSLVCEVGGTEWLGIRDVKLFANAFAKLRIDGPTMVDPMPALDDVDEPVTISHVPLKQFEDVVEHTIADMSPRTDRAAAPSILPSMQRFEDAPESTVVTEPLRSSEPPPPR